MTPPAAAAEAGRVARAGDRARRAQSVRVPRRVSGPARPTTPARLQLARRGGLLLALLSALERLASHPLLDRLIRGRAWLGLVTFALIGIVTLQLALLKLNGAVGRALKSEAVLQRENATLSIENSELSAADRVQARAAQAGMAFASSAELRFLSPNPHVDFARGASALSTAPRPAASNGEEGASARARAGASGEGSSSAGTSGERAAEGRASEGSRAEAAGETHSSSEAPAGSEAGSGESKASSASSEAPSSSRSPAPASEATSSAEAAPAGGAEAAPHG